MSIAVIGGGPAGAAAAATLAAAGRAVTLYERATGPTDKVCGDFLSPEGADIAERLGVDLDRLGASRIGRVRIVHGRTERDAALPFTARGLGRRVLDEALLAAAAARSAEIRRVAVRDLAPDGVAFRLSGPDTTVTTVLLATGKHRLRGAPAPERPGDLVGLKTYLRLTPARTEALRDHVELILFPGGYAGLQLVEEDRANLCLLVSRRRLQAAGDPRAFIDALRDTPAFARRLDGATELLPRPLAVSGLAYGFVHRPGRADPPNLFRLGDRAAVIPSLAGDGMSIALRSGTLAGQAIPRGADAGAYHAALRSLALRPVSRARVIQFALTTAFGRVATVSAAHVPGTMRMVARATRIAAAV